VGKNKSRKWQGEVSMEGLAGEGSSGGTSRGRYQVEGLAGEVSSGGTGIGVKWGERLE